MKFRFRLERVKRVRTLEESVARAAWAQAERAAQRAELEVGHYRQAVEEARAQVAARTGALSPRDAEVERRAIDRLLAGLRARKERALTARGQASVLGNAWRVRERDRRALEELEQRARARALLEGERRAALAMDEIAMERRRRLEADSSRGRQASDEGEPSAL